MLLFRERKAMYKTISVIDIDETIFNTHSKIGVHSSGVLIKELNNVEYNAYRLQENETFDFSQFSDSQFFYETSNPIEKNIIRVKRAIGNIEKYHTNNNHLILFLTARNLPDDYNNIQRTFEKYGMNVRNPDVQFAFAGGLKFPTTSQKKARVLDWYLRMNPQVSTVRMLDDDAKNINACAQVVSARKDIRFYGLQALRNGSLQRV